ncbi:Os11g0597601 [Oryza sativa Japonica Group]|uniref:Os11g0597601 protein n=1 Tax=Oryza sativa subsp. japonica TaxID=39947 RepID=C7J8R1_ORYSJ|nr:Os11g0597601 [Oryza sativa Japonica Group]|eukprot:NP_001176634.1 Os11g0597601 [Oryza sativa Japonica Group]
MFDLVLDQVMFDLVHNPFDFQLFFKFLLDFVNLLLYFCKISLSIVIHYTCMFTCCLILIRWNIRFTCCLILIRFASPQLVVLSTLRSALRQVRQKAVHALHLLLDELHVVPDATEKSRLVADDRQQ